MASVIVAQVANTCCCDWFWQLCMSPRWVMRGANFQLNGQGRARPDERERGNFVPAGYVRSLLLLDYVLRNPSAVDCTVHCNSYEEKCCNSHDATFCFLVTVRCMTISYIVLNIFSVPGLAYCVMTLRCVLGTGATMQDEMTNICNRACVAESFILLTKRELGMPLHPFSCP